jgi:hypothetical protein
MPIGIFAKDAVRTERRRADAAVGNGNIDAERHWQLQLLDAAGERNANGLTTLE